MGEIKEAHGELDQGASSPEFCLHGNPPVDLWGAQKEINAKEPSS